jgi:hypothetical protein
MSKNVGTNRWIILLSFQFLAEAKQNYLISGLTEPISRTQTLHSQSDTVNSEPVTEEK